MRLSCTNRSQLLDLPFPHSYNIIHPPMSPSDCILFSNTKRMTRFSWFSSHPHPIPIPIPELNCIGSAIYLLISRKGSLLDICHHSHHPCCYCYTPPTAVLPTHHHRRCSRVRKFRLVSPLDSVYPKLYFFLLCVTLALMFVFCFVGSSSRCE